MSSHPSPDNCPLEAPAKRLGQCARDMHKVMRQLRRERRACQRCAVEMETCPILQAQRALVEAAINSIVEAWNLSEVI